MSDLVSGIYFFWHKFSLVKGQGNVLAHALARPALETHSFWMENLPQAHKVALIIMWEEKLLLSEYIE